MNVTNLTREILRCRRERRRLKSEGWEEITERGGRLWELHRGYRIGYKITAVTIAPEGRTVFIKTVDTVAAGFDNDRKSPHLGEIRV